MRKAVTESENLTVNEIVRAKKFLSVKSRTLYCRNITCRDIPIHVNNTHLLRAWRNYPHISDFMDHLSPNEQKISPAKYPVRTLSAYATEWDKVSAYGVSLSVEKSRAILFVDRKRIVQNLADENGISLAVFESLNNKCLIYFSNF